MIQNHRFNVLVIWLLTYVVLIRTESNVDQYVSEFLNEVEQFKEEQKSLGKNREQLNKLKSIEMIPVDRTDVISLNVGGEMMLTTRTTLTRIPNSLFNTLFNGRWEERLQTDEDKNIFLDLNPRLFRHFFEQLRRLENMESYSFQPPNRSPSTVRSFSKMLKKLGYQVAPSSSDDLVTMNIGGQIRMTLQKTLIQSQIPILMSQSLATNGQVFFDVHPNLFQELIDRLRKRNRFNLFDYYDLWTKYGKRFYEMIRKFGFDSKFDTTTTTITTTTTRMQMPRIDRNAKWLMNGIAVAGGRSSGNATNQLSFPYGMIFDEDDERNLIIADSMNHRLVSWRIGAIDGQVMAGGCGSGNRTDQLNIPISIVMDRRKKDLIVSEWGNERIMRWSRQLSTTQQNRLRGQLFISNIICSGLAMDDEQNLYVSDWSKHEVRRYRPDDHVGSIVAGGHGLGDRLNQLAHPWNIFVDKDQSVYVSDWSNQRVMKWLRTSKEGVIVAGGHGEGHSLKQLASPRGLFVDTIGTVYVVDEDNHRVMRWYNGAKEGSVIVGGNGKGNQCHQLSGPMSVIVDQQNNLYVADYGNHRIQQFLIQ